MQTKFYQQTGVFLLKKKEKSLETLYELANQRRHESQLIGNLQLFSRGRSNGVFPGLQGFDQLLYASGGARVEGSLLTQILLAASGANLIQKKVNLDIRNDTCWINRSCFDQVILATGAWLPGAVETTRLSSGYSSTKVNYEIIRTRSDDK